MVALSVGAAIGAGCGDDSKDETTAAKNPPQPPVVNEPIPASLRTVESASEDIIDLALARKRAEVVRKARTLRSAATGPAARDLAKAGLPRDQLRVLNARAARVARLAPSAPLLDVALASNQTFALVPNYFSRYETTVPASVTQLDYLEFEALLRSKAGDTSNAADIKKTISAVLGLRATWASLRPQVKDSEVADRFEAHLEAMRQLGNNQKPEKLQREAQHGLALVDELEKSFAG